MEEEYQITIENGIVSAPKVPNNLEKGLGQFILDSCEKFSSKINQSCPYTNKQVTFKDFKIQSLNLAANLQRIYKIEKGDVIMSCMQNSLESGLPTVAAWYLAGISSCLDTTLAVHDCQHMIKIVQPKMIFLDEDSLSTIEKALENIPDLNPHLVINYKQEKKSGGSKNMKKYIDLYDLLLLSDNLNDSKQFQPVIINDQNTPASILFSSGTTGFSKGICLSHEAIYQGGWRFMNLLNYPQGFIYCTSLYWISGLLMLTGSFLNGSEKVTLRKFDVNFFCDNVKKYKINSTFLATSYINKILEGKHRVDDIKSLTNISFGGSCATKEQFEALQKAFSHVTFNQAYGLTESCGPNTFFTANHRQALEKFPGSSGLPINGYSIKIVDPKTEKIQGPYEKGEIRLKSDYSMLYYYNNTLDNPYDKDNFIKTGDIGYFGENYYLFVSGRTKDIFKYQSWHIVPASIEAVIQEHPAVEEVMVFGQPDPQDVGSFFPSAAIVLKETFKANQSNSISSIAEDIQEFVAQRVSDTQKLRGGVYFIKEFIKTPTGKIQRNKTFEMLKEMNILM